jgi:predicted regulator of Ras-like GTPase activity (Roadblock/LC7/MglB family)
MLNFFKNLFGSGGTDTHANGNGYTAAPAAAPLNAHPRQAAPSQASQPFAPRPPMPRSAPVTGGNGVQIPLYTIIAVLPLELKTRIRQTMVAEILVTLPLDRVLSQLGMGAVRITFGELRDLAPDVFSMQTDLDQTEISLPLNEILPQINPGLLARRQSQRHLQVPEDVRGPFGKDCSGVKFADTRTTSMPSSPAAAADDEEDFVEPPAPAPIPPPIARSAPPQRIVPPLSTIRPAPAAPTARFMPPVPSAKPASPFSPARPVPPPPAAPAAPAPIPAPAAESPLIPFRSSIASTPTPRPPTATPPANPPVRPAFPPSPRGVGAAPLPSAASRLPFAGNNGNGNGAGNAAARPPLPHPTQTAPAPQEVFLTVPMAMLSESWPEVLRNEIEQLNLSEAHLALPVRMVEAALKQGKVAFTWKMMRSWIRPATLPTVSAHDGMMLELPLRVIAPLFIARQKRGSQAQKKVQINEKIPNLFFGFPQGDSAAAVVEPPAPTPPMAPAPAPAPVAAPLPLEDIPDVFTPVGKKTGMPDTNFYTWGQNGEAPAEEEAEYKPKTSPGTDFLSRYATPNEVISRAAALDGVAGALVALPDGLMVASKLSADLNGDTLAAFLPHIFGKVSQCTKELRMGELNNLHFTVGNVPWKIFRVNAIFFAAFGHAGQPLPTAQLAALAGELDRKK